MPALETQNLSYSQTLFRLLAFMGEEIVVTTTVGGNQASGPILVGRLSAGEPLVGPLAGEPDEAVYFSLEDGGGFILAAEEFTGGEVMADAPVLRIDCGALTLWVSRAST